MSYVKDSTHKLWKSALVGSTWDFQFIMQGIKNVKIINAQQARIIHDYLDTKEKLFKTNAAI